MSNPPKPRQKILIQRADRLGDMILALPVITALQQAYPQAEIHVLTSAIGAEVLKLDDRVHRVWILDWSAKPWMSRFWEWVHEIRAQRYDLYVSLWNDPWMAWLGYLARIPVRLGDSTNVSLGWLYTHPVRQHWEDFCRHQVEFNLDLLAPLRVDVETPSAGLVLAEPLLTKAKGMLAHFFKEEQPVVVFFWGTGGSNIPIPEAVATEFLNRLAHEKTVNVVVLGQAAEVPVFHPLVLNLVNQTTFPELAGFVSACDVYIGSDTGPTHLAAALQKPILFFSPLKVNAPSRWGPITPYFEILRKDYACSAHLTPDLCTAACQTWLTTEVLSLAFSNLVNRLQEPPKSYADIRQAHWLAAIRVVVVVKTIKEFMYVERVASAAKKEGLIVFPFLYSGFWSLPILIRYLLQRNATVIQSTHLSGLWVSLIRFWIGAVRKTYPPVLVSVPFQHYVAASDYLSVYRAAFAQIPFFNRFRDGDE